MSQRSGGTTNAAPNAPNVNVPRIAFFFDAHKSDSSYLKFFP